MPVYEYSCAKCGEEFEQLMRSLTQQNTPTCPKCGSSDVRKAVSLFSVSGKSGSSKASAASCAPTGT